MPYDNTFYCSPKQLSPVYLDIEQWVKNAVHEKTDITIKICARLIELTLAASRADLIGPNRP